MSIFTNKINYYDHKSFLRNVDYKNFYLDSSNLPKVNAGKGDFVLVPPECNHRIDLFSYQQYKSSRLWWIIALTNADMIRDPIWDFKSGMTVFVPRDAALIERLTGNR